MSAAVAASPYIVLDEEYRIVDVAPVVEEMLGQFVGQNLWELNPGAREIFLPYYEQVYGTGEPVEFVQFYKGVVVRVSAFVDDGRLTMSWDVLGKVDVSTLDTLRTSLEEIVSTLADHRTGDEVRDHLRPLLRVVQGGG